MARERGLEGMTLRGKILVATVAMIALGGCGTVYRSASVSAGTSDASKVRVVPVTAETVVQANRAPDSRQSLPSMFSATVGAGNLRGAGALPEAPVTPETRPERLTLNPPPPFTVEAYEIGVGDVVRLSVPGSDRFEAEMSGLLAASNSRQGYTVQDDGAINVPDVGRVQLAGMSIEEAEAVLFQRLVENQIDPTFSLEIAEFNSKRVSIGGAVASPSVVPLQLTPLYLDEVIAASGGLAVEDPEFASIRIYRDGDLYQIPVDDMFSDSGLRRTRLKDGDAIYVDETYELDRAQAYFEQQIRVSDLRRQARADALQNLQTEMAIRKDQLEQRRENYLTQRELGVDERSYAYVTGEVGSQSRLPLPYGRTATLADALFDAGGGVVQGTGDISQIYVLRGASSPSEFGAVTAWHLNARDAAKFALATQFELRPNDVIFVAEQPITRWNRVITQSLPSISVARTVSQ